MNRDYYLPERGLLITCPLQAGWEKANETTVVLAAGFRGLWTGPAEMGVCRGAKKAGKNRCAMMEGRTACFKKS
jgi:hypothetical protein